LPIPWTSVSCAMSALVQVASCRPPLRRSIPTTPATLLSIDSSEPVAQRVVRRPVLVGTWQHRRQLLGHWSAALAPAGSSWSAGAAVVLRQRLSRLWVLHSSFHSALAGPQPPTHEPRTALHRLDLPEDRLNGPAGLGVAGLALGAVQQAALPPPPGPGARVQAYQRGTH
jgi:hypothetical protein